MGLDLVVAVMRGQEMQTSLGAAPFSEQAIAGRPRRFLDTGLGLFPFPDEDLVADRPGRQPTRHTARLGFAFRPQAVVDAEGADSAAALPRPFVGEDGKCQAVGSARHGDRDEGRGFERSKTVEPGSELGKAQGQRRRRGAQHPSFFFSCVDRSLMALPGCGKSRSSCISAMQALCF